MAILSHACAIPADAAEPRWPVRWGRACLVHPAPGLAAGKAGGSLAAPRRSCCTHGSTRWYRIGLAGLHRATIAELERLHDDLDSEKEARLQVGAGPAYICI